MMNCSNCDRKCCDIDQVEMSPKEINRIREYISRNNIDRDFDDLVGYVKPLKDIVYLLPDPETKYCPFFSEQKGRCLIYPVRPLCCKRFPLKIDPRLIDRYAFSLDFFNLNEKMIRNKKLILEKCVTVNLSCKRLLSLTKKQIEELKDMAFKSFLNIEKCRRNHNVSEHKEYIEQYEKHKEKLRVDVFSAFVTLKFFQKMKKDKYGLKILRLILNRINIKNYQKVISIFDKIGKTLIEEPKKSKLYYKKLKKQI